jgi:50S ribosomal protein L16 3-hydroxylase
MKILAELLGEEPCQTFLPKHFSRLPFSRPGGGTTFKSFLTWDTVREVLGAEKSVLRIVKDGQMVKDYVDLSFDDARTYHREGNTLLLRFAEKSSPRLLGLAQDFQRSFHTMVDIQLYCTPEGHNAFGWHYDVEEVFIIQTQGSKAYSLRPNTVHPNPLVLSIPKDQGYQNETADLEIKVTLEEGDFLYIPSGWWHVARTQRESMHISIGLMPSSAVDLAAYLPRYLARLPFWRTRMPVHLAFLTREEEIAFYQDAMANLGKDLERHIGSKEFIEEFLSWKKNP